MTLDEAYQEALVVQDYLRERGWETELQVHTLEAGGELVQLSVYLPQGPRGEKYTTFATLVYTELYGEWKWVVIYRKPVASGLGSELRLVDANTLFEAIEQFNAEVEAGRVAVGVKNTFTSEVIDRKLKARLLR